VQKITTSLRRNKLYIHVSNSTVQLEIGMHKVYCTSKIVFNFFSRPSYFIYLHSLLHSTCCQSVSTVLHSSLLIKLHHSITVHNIYARSERVYVLRYYTAKLLIAVFISENKYDDDDCRHKKKKLQTECIVVAKHAGSVNVGNETRYVR